MSLETEVAALTSATTDLLAAVNVSKATLDAAVSDAEDAATSAENNLGQYEFLAAHFLGAL